MKKFSVILLSLLVSITIVNAQERPEEDLSKKELRKERKRLKEEKLEKGREMALKALKERDFALRAYQFVNQQNKFVNVSEDSNGLIIDGDEIYIYQGDSPQVGFNNWGELNFQGKIEKIKIVENSKKKRIDAVLYVSNTLFPKPMTIFLKMFGENNEARLVFGTDVYRLRGRFERGSEFPKRVFPLPVPHIGMTGY